MRTAEEVRKLEKELKSQVHISKMAEIERMIIDAVFEEEDAIYVKELTALQILELRRLGYYVGCEYDEGVRITWLV